MLAAILRAHFGDARVLATRRQPQQCDRPAADAAAPARGARGGGDRARHEPSGRDRGARRDRAADRRRRQQRAARAPGIHEERRRRRRRACGARSCAAALAARRCSTPTIPSVDVWRAAARERPGVRVIEFALDHPAAIRARARRAGGRHAVGTVDTRRATRPCGSPRRDGTTCRTRSPRRAAALAIGVPLAAVVRGLEAFRPVAGRLAARRARSGARVIDDTYNANPDSVRAAIDVLAAAPPPRWLVLGDMGEVGDERPRVPSRGRRVRARRAHRPAADRRQRWLRRARRRSAPAPSISRRWTRSRRMSPRRRAPERRCSSRARGSCAWSASSRRSAAPAAGAGAH